MCGRYVFFRIRSNTSQENRKSIIIHIVELYGERFKSIETYGVVEQISRRYAQYHDTSGVAIGAGTEAIDRHQQPNGMDKWATGIKEMDSVEEDYFNGDEEDDVSTEPLPAEDVASEKPFELKRRRSVDDEGEDELLQLAQKSPHTKGSSIFFSYSSEATEDSNGARPSSSSSPTSSPKPSPPIGKRPRESDEQEDEMDRLSRSSKRVVSPTDVKRKPSRGALNGGRKIAISIGKK